MFNLPLEPPAIMNWLRYEQSLAVEGGIYLLVIADGFAPFYAGTALSFEKRLSTHKNYFCNTAQRTFFRPAFMAGMKPSPEAIITRWQEVLARNDFAKFVYVPGTSPLDGTIVREGSNFWDGLIILVCPVERTLEETAIDYKSRLRKNEYFLQKKMEKFYESYVKDIDFRIPTAGRGYSMLFGRRECSGQEAREVENWSTQYAFNSRDPASPTQFLASLPQITQAINGLGAAS